MPSEGGSHISLLASFDRKLHSTVGVIHRDTCRGKSVLMVSVGSSRGGGRVGGGPHDL